MQEDDDDDEDEADELMEGDLDSESGAEDREWTEVSRKVAELGGKVEVATVGETMRCRLGCELFRFKSVLERVFLAVPFDCSSTWLVTNGFAMSHDVSKAL